MSHHWKIWIFLNYFKKNLLVEFIFICSKNVDEKCDVKCEESGQGYGSGATNKILDI